MSDLLEKARSLAIELHKGQFCRDGVTSYFEGHVEPVALDSISIAKYYFMEVDIEKVGSIAYLHDSVEDSKDKYKALAKIVELHFPREVVSAVVAITKVDGENYNDYLQRVKNNCMASFVKVRDINHNLSDDPTEKQKIKYEKALKFLNQ